MRRTIKSVSVTCSRISNTLRQCSALHHHVETQTPTNDCLLDIYATNHLINMHAKAGDLGIAHKLFSQMPQKNIVSWTALISGYAQHGHMDQCFGLLSEMLAHIRPNDYAYTSLLSVCDHPCGIQVHALILKTGFDAWIFVGNALLQMYWKNGLDIGVEACRAFETMQAKNLVTYNSMIAGFGSCGQGNKAMEFFRRMCRDGVSFDHATFLSFNSSWSGFNSDIERHFCCLQLHCTGLKSGFGLDVGVMTALITAYSNVSGEASDCYKLFLETTSLQRDIVLWTAIMTALSDMAPEETLVLFNQMRLEDSRPDCYVFSVLLKASANLVTESHASAVHSLVIKLGYISTQVLGNALIHAYARCGFVHYAKQVFCEMRSRDIVSWNSMLKAYAVNGEAEAALRFFELMDVAPDGTTFVALLSACSHSGMVEEGTKIFESMHDKYRINPQLDHYACMVDILGRAGHFTKAEEIIKKMPMQPDSVVWSALLGACQKHGETKLGNIASAKLKELDPENSLGYVMISNIYCLAYSFDRGSLVRKKMDRTGVRKEPGLSWIEVGRSMHEFASGGNRHPQLEAIRSYLEELLIQLRNMGYVPMTSLVMYDVEEEHKEEQLYLHSEKLALAFSLMNADDKCFKGDTIKIKKNIRICLDCHNFMCITSKLVQKVIIVRDANRFHHFKEGTCSCNNYW